MIEVRYRGGLGNRAFQYSLGRILAEKLGLKLVCDPLPGFSNTFEPVIGEVCLKRELVLSGHVIPLAEILDDPTPRHIILDGFFQRAEYYRPFAADIRQWLSFGSIPQPPTRPDVVMHVRRADYVKAGWALPFAYYEQALARLWSPGRQLWIVTDDPADPFLRHFRRWEPRLASGSDLEQLQLMAVARRLIMSQSTFSWWAAFLAEDQKAACPVPAHGCWAGDQEITRGTSLIEPDQFICIACPAAYRATGIERHYQIWRHARRRAAMSLNRFLNLSLPISER